MEAIFSYDALPLRGNSVRAALFPVPVGHGILAFVGQGRWERPFAVRWLPHYAQRHGRYGIRWDAEGGEGGCRAGFVEGEMILNDTRSSALDYFALASISFPPSPSTLLCVLFRPLRATAAALGVQPGGGECTELYGVRFEANDGVSAPAEGANVRYGGQNRGALDPVAVEPVRECAVADVEPGRRACNDGGAPVPTGGVQGELGSSHGEDDGGAK